MSYCILLFSTGICEAVLKTAKKICMHDRYSILNSKVKHGRKNKTSEMVRDSVLATADHRVGQVSHE